ncbi:MAG: tRNA dihydrouridine synthase DusB [Bacillota bacterium]
MKIGDVCIPYPVVLAPMAGVTDISFRRLVKGLGCGLICTEMVSDKGLIYKNQATWKMLAFHDDERPVSMQIFGAEPATMAEAAKIVAATGVDMIDINMGCPTPKIVKNGEGAALMRTPDLAYAIICAVVDAVDKPVTVKIRAGWDAQHRNAVEIARLAERAGAQAVAVHGRTREQFYTGKADWQVIGEVKSAVSIPVIGNGDIHNPQDAKRMLAETGCDAVMVGRAAQGNPWIFPEIISYLTRGYLLNPPDMSDKIAVFWRHFTMLIQDKGEYVAVREMRKHAAWYTKGYPHAAKYRVLFNQADTREDFRRIFHKWRLDSGGVLTPSES